MNEGIGEEGLTSSIDNADNILPDYLTPATVSNVLFLTNSLLGI